MPECVSGGLMRGNGMLWGNDPPGVPARFGSKPAEPLGGVGVQAARRKSEDRAVPELPVGSKDVRRLVTRHSGPDPVSFQNRRDGWLESDMPPAGARRLHPGEVFAYKIRLVVTL